MLYPKHKTEIKTKLTPKAVQLTLKTDVESSNVKVSGWSYRIVTEHIDEKSFCFLMTRLFNNKANLPMVYGTYSGSEEGTVINVEFRRRWVDIVGFALFCCAFASILLYVTVQIKDIILIGCLIIVAATFCLAEHIRWNRNVNKMLSKFKFLLK